MIIHCTKTLAAVYQLHLLLRVGESEGIPAIA
jgi:hypothetical protein